MGNSRLLLIFSNGYLRIVYGSDNLSKFIRIPKDVFYNGNLYDPAFVSYLIKKELVDYVFAEVVIFSEFLYDNFYDVPKELDFDEAKRYILNNYENIDFSVYDLVLRKLNDLNLYCIAEKSKLEKFEELSSYLKNKVKFFCDYSLLVLDSVIQDSFNKDCAIILLDFNSVRIYSYQSNKLCINCDIDINTYNDIPKDDYNLLSIENIDVSNKNPEEMIIVNAYVNGFEKALVHVNKRIDNIGSKEIQLIAFGKVLESKLINIKVSRLLKNIIYFELSSSSVEHYLSKNISSNNIKLQKNVNRILSIFGVIVAIILMSLSAYYHIQYKNIRNEEHLILEEIEKIEMSSNDELVFDGDFEERIITYKENVSDLLSDIYNLNLNESIFIESMDLCNDNICIRGHSKDKNGLVELLDVLKVSEDDSGVNFNISERGYEFLIIKEALND